MSPPSRSSCASTSPPNLAGHSLKQSSGDRANLKALSGDCRLLEQPVSFGVYRYSQPVSSPATDSRLPGRSPQEGRSRPHRRRRRRPRLVTRRLPPRVISFVGPPAVAVERLKLSVAGIENHTHACGLGFGLRGPAPSPSRTRRDPSSSLRTRSRYGVPEIAEGGRSLSMQWDLVFK